MLRTKKKVREMIMEDAFKLRRELEELLEKVRSTQRCLANIEQSCRHDWTDPEYTPERYEGYHDPGDPPGTMGIDRRLPFDVPPRTVDKWTRSCKKCGKSESTSRTEAKVKHIPKF
jgi:hypothetical protein